MMILHLIVSLALSANRQVDKDIAVIVNRYIVRLPSGVSVRAIGPNVAIHGPAYEFKTDGGVIVLFVLPFHVSKSLIRGECTASTEYDQHLRDGPVFCEGQTLTHPLKTELGAARWQERTEDATSGMRTAMSPYYVPPPYGRYSHTYVAAIPIKADDVILEFYLTILGTKERAGTPSEARLWPLLRDQLLPSLQRY